MQEGDTPLASFIEKGLVAAWSAKGKNNTDTDRNILKDLSGQGHNITLYGFAYNDESGYSSKYPNALLFDGKNTYGECTNMPIQTDFTIIAKRRILEKITTSPCLMSKAQTVGVGAFIFEFCDIKNNTVQTYSFNYASAYINPITPITYSTATNFNGYTIRKGSASDTNYLCLGNIRKGDSARAWHGAFYWAALFNKSLTTEEIDEFIIAMETPVGSKINICASKTLEECMEDTKFNLNTLYFPTDSNNIFFNNKIYNGAVHLKSYDKRYFTLDGIDPVYLAEDGDLSEVSLCLGVNAIELYNIIKTKCLILHDDPYFGFSNNQENSIGSVIIQGIFLNEHDNGGPDGHCSGIELSYIIRNVFYNYKLWFQTQDTEGTYLYLTDPLVVKLNSLVGKGFYDEGGTDPQLAGEIFNDYENNTASGSLSHAEGFDCHAIGEQSHAEGNSNISNGHCSHTEGVGNETNGENSHAEGSYNYTSGYNSHAEGRNNTADGHNSHVEGLDNEVTGESSHVEGDGNICDAKCSHVEGTRNTARGNSSHVEGTSNISTIDNQHVEGQYSKESNSIHIVGIGTSGTSRKNAHEITLEGKHYIPNIGGYDGTNKDSATDLATVIGEFKAPYIIGFISYASTPADDKLPELLGKPSDVRAAVQDGRPILMVNSTFSTPVTVYCSGTASMTFTWTYCGTSTTGTKIISMRVSYNNTSDTFTTVSTKSTYSLTADA